MYLATNGGPHSVAMFTRWVDCERYVTSEVNATYRRYDVVDDAIRDFYLKLGLDSPFSGKAVSHLLCVKRSSFLKFYMLQFLLRNEPDRRFHVLKFLHLSAQSPPATPVTKRPTFQPLSPLSRLLFPCLRRPILLIP